MSTTRRKGKAYRPIITKHPLMRVLPPAPAAASALLMTRFRSALRMIEAGQHPGADEWRELADVINTLEMLVNMSELDHDEVMPCVDQAIKGMAEAAIRWRAGEPLRLDQAGLNAVRDALAIYEQCLAGLSGATMAQARRETDRRINAVRRGKRDDRVIAV